MKIIVTFCCITAIFLCACNKTQSSDAASTKICSLIIDRTDQFISLPDSATICKRFNLGENLSLGAIYRLQSITDIEHTPITQFALPAQNFLLQNPGQRKKGIKSFYSNINSSLVQLQSLPAGKSYSEIYTVIAREANAISQMKGDRELICYTDLYENTSLFSMYSISDLEMLARSPDKVVALFQKEQPLQNLAGLHLYLIYTAKDQKDSQRYKAISNIYKQMFESKNAIVTVSANLEP